jgi:hypothetical protein
MTSIASFFGYGHVLLQTRDHNSPYLVDDLIYYLYVSLCAVYGEGIEKPGKEQGYCHGTCFGNKVVIFRTISVFPWLVGSLLFAICNGELISTVLKLRHFGA